MKMVFIVIRPDDIFTIHFQIITARLTFSAGIGDTTHSGVITNLKFSDILSNGHYSPCNLMTGNHWIILFSPITVCMMNIRVTDTGIENFHHNIIIAYYAAGK